MASDEDDYMPSEVGSGDAGASDHESAAENSGVESYRSGPVQPPHDSDEEARASASPSSLVSSTSRKREADHHHLAPYAGAPLKRRRRAFNPAYLSLLNQDIADASISLIASDTADFKPSQIGAVRWSPVEKEAFFSALGRLGRDDLPGIATRVGTKSPLEVRQYVMLLEERTRRRRDDGELRRKTPRTTEIPAAVDLSHECTVALEEAADDLALRQENYEVTAEERRWGDRWLITQKGAIEDVDQGDNNEKDDEEMPFLDFFHVRTWLRLSERSFMNSVIPDYNWRYVSEEPPAIRATALSDFHTLAISVIKRLVASTLFMAGMRIKAQKEYMPFTKDLVKAKDVAAAVDSLNMKGNNRDFWARAPRRLRLDVTQDATDPDEGEGKEEECEEDHIMSYDEVEAALGLHRAGVSTAPITVDSISEMDEDEEDDSDLPLPEDDELAEETGEEAEVDIDRNLDQEAIKRDMLEAMYFSADYEFTTRARQGLQTRVEEEYRMEEDAEEQDVQASRQEEEILWGILHGKDVAAEMRARDNASKQWVRRVALEPVAKNWRESTNYASDWETR